MNFWDEIYMLREQGMVPKVWTRACLRPHLQGKYMPNSISTIPSNGSMTRDGKRNGQLRQTWARRESLAGGNR